MHETGKNLLNLMFRPGEKICVSDNQAGYHCISLENATSNEATLVHPDPDKPNRKVTTDKLIFVALNPSKGWCRDEDIVNYRSFLVEMDSGPLEQQREHMDRIALPYSAIVFSGGKSLHYLITLEKDLPNEEAYRHISEWLLRAIPLADQNTKNPSRKIRIPGAMRNTGKMQELVDLKGPVSLLQLSTWLNMHPDAKPRKYEKSGNKSDPNSYTRLNKWTRDRLTKGLDPDKGRNKQWFAIGCEFALCGYSLDDTLDILSDYFTPDSTFTTRELKTAIKSAFKRMDRSK